MGQCLDYGQLGRVSTLLSPIVIPKRELSKPLGDSLITKMLDIRGFDLRDSACYLHPAHGTGPPLKI